MKINTIETLLKEIYRYEPEILKKIFQFMFIPIYEDKERKYKYVELLPKPGTDCITSESFKSGFVSIFDKPVRLFNPNLE